MAERVNERLQGELPQLFTPAAAYVAFWQQGTYGSVEVWVYFYTTTCS